MNLGVHSKMFVSTALECSTSSLTSHQWCVLLVLGTSVSNTPILCRSSSLARVHHDRGYDRSWGDMGANKVDERVS